MLVQSEERWPWLQHCTYPCVELFADIMLQNLAGFYFVESIFAHYSGTAPLSSISVVTQNVFYLTELTCGSKVIIYNLRISIIVYPKSSDCLRWLYQCMIMRFWGKMVILINPSLAGPWNLFFAWGWNNLTIIKNNFAIIKNIFANNSPSQAGCKLLLWISYQDQIVPT